MGDGSVTARYLFANRVGLQSAWGGEPSEWSSDCTANGQTLAKNMSAPTELVADLTDIYKDFASATELRC
jgi:hypothetical protein